MRRGYFAIGYGISIVAGLFLNKLYDAVSYDVSGIGVAPNNENMCR